MERKRKRKEKVRSESTNRGVGVDPHNAILTKSVKISTEDISPPCTMIQYDPNYKIQYSIKVQFCFIVKVASY